MFPGYPGACMPHGASVPSPALAAFAPSAGVGCGLFAGEKRDPIYENPCNCHPNPDQRLHPSPKYSFGADYQQPKIPTNYAPKRCFLIPTCPMETHTTYNLSYLASDDYSRSEPVFKPIGNLSLSCEPMSCATTHRMSYLWNTPFRTSTLTPYSHDIMGQGPMQCVTTHRHDYVPKPISYRQSFAPRYKYHCVKKPFEKRTIHRMSYIDPGRQPPVRSYAATMVYEKPAVAFDGSTTHRMSYQPVCVPQRQRPPWACKGQYQKPCQKFDSWTIYRSSYLPPGQDCSQCMDDTCKYPDTKPCNVWQPKMCYASKPTDCIPTSNVFPKAGF